MARRETRLEMGRVDDDTRKTIFVITCRVGAAVQFPPSKLGRAILSSSILILVLVLVAGGSIGEGMRAMA